MKKVHFEELGISWIWAGFLLISTVSIGFELFDVFQFEKVIWNKILGALPHIILVIYWSRPFWYRYHVQYNSRFVMVRLGTFFGKTLIFEKIKSYTFNEKMLTVLRTSNKINSFDLSQIRVEDRQKLLSIFEKRLTLV